METNFCGCRSQRRRAPLSYRQAQSSGGGVITVGIWIIKAGICVIIPLPRVIKAGTRFIKQPYKPQRPPKYAPYSTLRAHRVKLPSERQTLSERLTGALRGCLTTSENFSFPQTVIFRNVKFWQVFHYAPPSAPVCVTTPQINGEGTETLCTAFLYKKRKITAPKTKRFKRAFPFVLRGLVIFGCVGAAQLFSITLTFLNTLTNLNISCKGIVSSFGHLLVSE